jgi:hypothetical protein
MPDRPIESELAVEVDGDQRIVVTVPASYYRVSFFRRPNEASLSPSPSVVVDSTVDLPRHEFEQLASEVAKAKARELGWIKLAAGPEAIGRGSIRPKESYLARKLQTRVPAMTGKRELIDTGTDKRYVRRDKEGQFKESTDVSRSLPRDVRHKAKKVVKPGYGDRGDQERGANS